MTMIRAAVLLAIIILTGCTLAHQGAFDLSGYKNSNTVASSISGPDINVLDFYADPTGTTPSDAAFQAAVAAANSCANPGVLFHIPSGKYLLTQPIGAFTRHRVHVRGDGKYATTIQASESVFKWANPTVGASIWQSSLCDLSITNSGASSKVAIELEDVRDFLIRDIAIQNWSSALSDSVGLLVRGREMVRAENLYVKADNCIQIKVNPATTWISADHFHWSGLYLIGMGSGPIINVDNDCAVFNWTIDGTNSFNCGGDGIRWSGAGLSPTRALNISFSNIRREQVAAGSFWLMDLQPSAGCRDIHIANVSGGYPTNGYRLKCDRASLERILYDSSSTTAVAIDASQVGHSLNVHASFWQVGPSVNISGLTQVSRRDDTVDPCSFAAYGLWEK